MKIIKISSTFYCFQFLEVLDRVTYTTNVYALIDKGRVLLIDTGYRAYSQKIREYFLNENLHVTDIIITHYHRDHAEGSVLFEHARIYASDQYEENFRKCQEMLHTEMYHAPDICVEDKYLIDFGSFKVKLIKTPGHTKCGMSVLIDDQYLLPSDLILQDMDNKAIVPYIDISSNPEDHLKSLRMLQILEYKFLCLSHGSIIEKPKSDYLISERIYYLERFIESNYEAELDYCIMGPKESYAMIEIHKLNKRNAKRLTAR